MIIYADVIEFGADVEPLPNESISVQDGFGNVISAPVMTKDGKLGMPFPLNFKTPGEFLDWYSQNRGKPQSSWIR